MSFRLLLNLSGLYVIRYKSVGLKTKQIGTSYVYEVQLKNWFFFFLNKSEKCRLK